MPKANKYRSFDVKQDVQDEWNTYGDQILERTVWSSSCKSWYKNSTGRIFALYPGSILHFKDMIENIRGEDFDITYRNPKVRHKATSLKPYIHFSQLY